MVGHQAHLKRDHKLTMSLIRYSDWQTRLHRYLMSAATRPFAWGVFDCVHHSADAILAMTGTDILTDIRHRYDSLLTSKKLLQDFGGDVWSATEMIANKYQMPEVKPLFAQRGDLVVIDQHGESLSGIVDLSGKISAVTSTGCLVLNLRAAARAWSV